VAVCALYLYVVNDAARRARVLESFELGPDQRWTVYVGIVLFAATTVSPLAVSLLPYQTFLIPSESMEPTVLPGDHLVARKGSMSVDELESSTTTRRC